MPQTVACEYQVPDSNCQTEIAKALQILKSGGVVALPTDTLYGLGVDVFAELALQRVFAIKGRPPELALPVLVADWEQAQLVIDGVTEVGRRLAQRFWPGPLTLVLPASPRLSVLVTGGRDTVAVRMPDHWVPLALAAQLGAPITGTSANRSGKADLLTVNAVETHLDHQVDYIMRCGPTPKGIASTVVDATGETPRLLRAGALPFDQILEASQ